MNDTLIIDTQGLPVAFVNWKRAITLVFNDRADIMEEDSERILRSPSFTMNMPRIVRLKNHIAAKFMSRQHVPLTRRNVAVRDKSCCQYCGVVLSTEEYTLDHIIPRSKGGLSTWNNLVLACVRCNKRKGNRSLVESHMSLLHKPNEPSPRDPRFNFRLHVRKMHPSWQDYVDQGWLYWNEELSK